MLYLIGLGLNDENDVSLKAVNALRGCDLVFAEFYTNNWHGDLSKLENIAGKKIKVLPREKVESNFITEKAKKNSVALLIPGDPLTATTHIELLLEAKKQKIESKVIHASSIYTAVTESGLQLYKFGRTTTLVYPEGSYEPKSPYDVIKDNRKAGLHTLVLLDIKEGKNMTVKEGAELLVKNGAVKKDEKIVACCRLGGDQEIAYDSVSALLKREMPAPAAIVIPGKLNFKEEEALSLL